LLQITERTLIRQNSSLPERDNARHALGNGLPCPGSIPDAEHLFRYVTNQPAKASSAFYPSGVGKWVPASAGKARQVWFVTLADERGVCR